MPLESVRAWPGTMGLAYSPLLKGVSSMRFIVLSALVLAPLVGSAQERASPPPRGVPANQMPPAGKCRIWMDGVAPAQQPAPTDCQTALRQKPPNGTVIFGPQPKAREPETFETQPARHPPSARGAPAATPAPAKVPPPRDTARPPARKRRPAADRPERP